ncbi:AAA family ATPase [Bradyrhizobium sp. AUGA SZCCT0240]|uniref:AAA family ATPase n=1 Tax=unclassified Bradyrhizobium TaxID=2631580 RepID=UPI001BA8F211|nr:MULTISPECIES: AAA family ATPase [unclassified Bradyrhizobium]MBR1195904.1 AAA family ATPase [Bradyrhizobium sp. AUGA SZCCT0158]MBR1240741.1 AAA family ATPase [Bradyrhizobium sp. AUGA SZCCT0274]MBR1252235.1 AAA family ATPase [Bradyrhizobium sp. AUGA SZCCT0240]
MQRFDRNRVPPPEIFRSGEAQRNRLLLRDYLRVDTRKRAQTTARQGMQLLKDSSVAEALGRLFHGKCAFCEERVSTKPYRFRPPAEARPFVASDIGHLYYVWLADAWENIYSICDRCLPSEVDYFPVKGSRTSLPTDLQIDRYVEEAIGLWRDHPPRERALLLDPCGRSELYGHFQVHLSGALKPRTDAAEATIEHFRLNYPGLVQARYKRYTERIRELIAALTYPETDRPRSDLFAFVDMEFGGSWFILLRRLAKTLQAQGMPPIGVSRNGIAAGFLQLYGRRDIDERLSAAMATIDQEDRTGQSVVHTMAPMPRRSRARLTSVQVQNFRSIESLELTLPQYVPETTANAKMAVPSVLILGENAAGKSSLLEAITLALADPATRAALSLPIDRLPLDPRYMGAGPDHPRRDAEVTLTLDGSWSHRLTISVNGYIDRTEPNAAMPPVFAYGAFRHYIDRRRKHAPAKYVQSLFRPDQLLSNPERWLLSLDQIHFDMVVRALRDIFSIEEEFDVVQRDPEAKRCVIVTRMSRPNGDFVDVTTPLEIASSGFRSVLAMVCDIFEGLMDPRIYEGFETLAAARAVVLIDEVEAHLHPRWKMQIMRGLRMALPNVTFIATTHDPLCLRGMDDGEVRVMQKVPGSEVMDTDLPVFVEQLHELPPVSNLTLEQLLTSDLFQLFSTDTPETDATLATIGDLLARQRAGEPLTTSEKDIITRFDTDIASALPVGSSEVHRLVQEAVVVYLRERRTASEDRMRRLREDARSKIVDALRGI